MANERTNRRYPLDWITLYNVAVNRRMYYAQQVDDAKRDWVESTLHHNNSPPTFRTGRTPDEIFNRHAPNGLLTEDYRSGIRAHEKNIKILNYAGQKKTRVTVMKRYKMSQRPQAIGRLALAPIKTKHPPNRRDIRKQNGGNVEQNGGVVIQNGGDWQHQVSPKKHEIKRDEAVGVDDGGKSRLTVNKLSRNVTEYEAIESIYKRNDMKLPNVLKLIKGRPAQSQFLYQKQGPELDDLPALGYSSIS